MHTIEIDNEVKSLFGLLLRVPEPQLQTQILEQLDVPHIYLISDIAKTEAFYKRGTAHGQMAMALSKVAQKLVSEEKKLRACKANLDGYSDMIKYDDSCVKGPKYKQCPDSMQVNFREMSICYHWKFDVTNPEFTPPVAIIHYVTDPQGKRYILLYFGDYERRVCGVLPLPRKSYGYPIVQEDFKPLAHDLSKWTLAMDSDYSHNIKRIKDPKGMYGEFRVEAVDMINTTTKYVQMIEVLKMLLGCPWSMKFTTVFFERGIWQKYNDHIMRKETQ